MLGTVRALVASVGSLHGPRVVRSLIAWRRPRPGPRCMEFHAARARVAPRPIQRTAGWDRSHMADDRIWVQAPGSNMRGGGTGTCRATEPPDPHSASPVSLVMAWACRSGLRHGFWPPYAQEPMPEAPPAWVLATRCRETHATGAFGMGSCSIRPSRRGGADHGGAGRPGRRSGTKVPDHWDKSVRVMGQQVRRRAAPGGRGAAAAARDASPPRGPGAGPRGGPQPRRGR